MGGDRIQIYSTKRFEWEVLVDGIAWDLTDATVTLFLKAPDGTITENAATVDAPATDGVAYFDCAATTLDAEGGWTGWWKGVVGDIEEFSDVFSFRVYDPSKH